MSTESATTHGLTLSDRPPDRRIVHFHGRWIMSPDMPDVETLLSADPAGNRPRKLELIGGGLSDWDSGLLAFLLTLSRRCEALSIQLTRSGFPEGVERLMDLASSGSAGLPAPDSAVEASWIERTGASAIQFWRQFQEGMGFIGETTLAAIRFPLGTTRFRSSDLFRQVFDVGARALPIVSLISLLVGLIMAFVGAVQLRMFGAQIYVANLVGLAMAREMGPMMTGVIMAGRTGAAFAAQLGTMRVNDEIDALETLGVSPIEFLVLPRVIALVLMMPLLCLYADLMGILGGLSMGVADLDLTVAEYVAQTRAAVGLNDFAVGLVKSLVFALVVALCGCFRGLYSGRSASAVGEAATAAVVSSILYIIIFDAVITVICDAIGA
ncbi:MAG: MlaE family ABC transporter permease [Desulfobacterales bacterium]